MRRVMLALIVLVAPAQAHLVTPLPGISLELPDGPRMPLSVLAHEIPEFDLSSIAGATPETTTALGREVCDKILGPMPPADCAAHAGTVAGQRVLIADAKAGAGRKPVEVRAYFFARGRETGEIGFSSPENAAAAMRPVIERIVASIKVAPAPPPRPLQYVRLKPVEGVALSIPKGWIACDRASNVLLGEARDPFVSRPSTCNRNAETGDARFFHPHRPTTTMMRVMSEPEPSGDPGLVQRLTPEAMAANREQDCKEAQSGLDAVDVSGMACRTGFVALGGHPAELIASSFSAKHDGVPFHVACRTYIAAANGRVVILSFVATSALQPDLGPADAIVKSVSFQ